MAEFTLRGVALSIPDAALGGNLAAALQSGRYEHTEADAVMRHLVPGDRFVDLGAGAGYLCCLAGRVLGAAAVAGVEALPGMVEVARANLARNGLAGAEILHGALVGPDQPGGTVPFRERAAFWASALAPPGTATPKGMRLHEVPALKLGALLDRLAPTVIVCDIEGAERDVLDIPLPPPLRMLVVEIHPAIYGLAGTGQLFDALARRGFAYQPYGSHAATVVFERVAPRP